MDDSEKIVDEEEDCNCESEPAQITPELDPRALPKSIGLSFVVNGRDQLRISFCATWARYKKGEKCWQRFPSYLIKKEVELIDETWKAESDSGVVIN